jgi:hypothetical protein
MGLLTGDYILSCKLFLLLATFLVGLINVCITELLFSAFAESLKALVSFMSVRLSACIIASPTGHFRVI